MYKCRTTYGDHRVDVWDRTLPQRFAVKVVVYPKDINQEEAFFSINQEEALFSRHGDLEKHLSQIFQLHWVWQSMKILSVNLENATLEK